jgi:hypothetical protein
MQIVIKLEMNVVLHGAFAIMPFIITALVVGYEPMVYVLWIAQNGNFNEHLELQ